MPFFGMRKKRKYLFNSNTTGVDMVIRDSWMMKCLWFTILSRISQLIFLLGGFLFSSRLLYLDATLSITTPIADENILSKKNDDSMIQINEKIVIDKVWSAVYTDFCLLTHNQSQTQYVAYYNSDRQTVIGMRRINYNMNVDVDGSSSSNNFQKYILPSPNSNHQPPVKGNRSIGVTASSSTIQGWDTHNYLTLGVDGDGYLHFAGNMHATPLLYFRMEELGNISSMKHVPVMVNKQMEARSTYPNFMYTPDGELLFHYRFGGSGNGKEYFNRYDTQNKRWNRFQDDPLFGTNERKNSAYQAGPLLGPDGWYHLLWMWRSSPDAETNHDISYAKSRDLKRWLTADGTKTLELPMTVENSRAAIIDPVPEKGGLLNTVHHIGFDSQHRPVISYHKNDQNGKTQACVARYDDSGLTSANNNSRGSGGSGSWKVSIISDWKYSHTFHGKGALVFDDSWIYLGIVELHNHRQLALPFQHWKHGDGLLIFDEETLQPIRVVPGISSRYPSNLNLVESKFPGMTVRWLDDNPFRQHHQIIDPPPRPNEKDYYAIRWESLGSNRDKPRDKPWPENSTLVLYSFGRQEVPPSLRLETS